MDGWYYSRNGQSVGPIALAQLKQLAAAGEVSPEDQVWHPSLAGWTAARKVPGLVPMRAGRSAPMAVNAPPPSSTPAAPPVAEPPTDVAPPASADAPATAAAAPAAHFEPIMVHPGGRAADGASTSADSSASSSGQTEVHFRTIQILHYARPWLAILAVAMFIVSVATLLTAVSMLSGSANFAQMLRQQSGYVAAPVTFQIVLCAIVYLIIALLAAILGLHLVRAIMHIGALLLHRRSHDLEKALAVQLTCWRFAAIFVIASVVLAVVIALVL